MGLNNHEMNLGKNPLMHSRKTLTARLIARSSLESNFISGPRYSLKLSTRSNSSSEPTYCLSPTLSRTMASAFSSFLSSTSTGFATITFESSYLSTGSWITRRFAISPFAVCGSINLSELIGASKVLRGRPSFPSASLKHQATYS